MVVALSFASQDWIHMSPAMHYEDRSQHEYAPMLSSDQGHAVASIAASPEPHE